jgi:DNA-directed RNA polymerase specialized sigma24 family protein
VSPVTDARAQRFAALYEDSYGAIHAYASRRAGREAADEIAAETFLVAWRRFDALPAEPLPWLYGVARNVVLRHHADRGRQRQTRAALEGERRWSQLGAGDGGDPGLWEAWEQLSAADVWDAIIAEGRRVVQRLADLEMPIVAAVNGPATVHSEYALLADIVVASETTVFGDFPHLTFGIVPGDGVHVIWEEALGLNRARHLILTQGQFTAAEALHWGAIAEVVAQEKVQARAMELAEGLASRPQLLNRYLAITIRQRLSRRLAEGTVLGMSLEGITAANMPYLDQR